ncbi:hypothetical protein SSE37_04305 [Sagittula stellata E-37]|uniref:Uncharacterized protein n=2 Tax=Sagittula stellata TaxID=52603 RepID=A3K1P1_SAGS3|nr:hypothetical protein SSE37_04305 [Sagittula stellata E-37]
MKENDMSLDTLQDVYVDQLQDLYSACEQAQKVMDDLTAKAESEELRAALEHGKSGISDGRAQLAGMIKAHGADPKGEHCKGMQGLVAEARAHALDAEFGDGAVRDAMIITQYQRMTHYAIAGYGCCAAFANRLEHLDDAKTLGGMLDAAYSGDRHFSGIAMGDVNRAAAE